MIDDIVMLPRRLAALPYDVSVVSLTDVITPPSVWVSQHELEPLDEGFGSNYGTSILMPGKNSALHRFKIIENLPDYILEYVCVGEECIDPLNLTKNKGIKVNCVLVNMVDRKTFKQRRFLPWNPISAIKSNYCDLGVPGDGIPIEVAMANKIRSFSREICCPELSEMVANYPTESVAVSEDMGDDLSTIMNYEQLCANINDFNSYCSAGPYGLDGRIVLSGVELPGTWGDVTPIMNSSVGRMLLRGNVPLEELFRFISPRYRQHLFHYRPFGDGKLNSEDSTDLINDTENYCIFTIVKLIERIPYGEFTMRLDRGKPKEVKVLSPYSLNELPTDKLDVATIITLEKEIQRAVTRVFPNYSRICVTRSWSEEVYITILDASGQVLYRQYADLAILAPCTRLLVRENYIGW